jgi:hypothetical protein
MISTKMLRLARLLAVSGLCCLACGCGWRQRGEIYKVVDDYCGAEVRGDKAAQMGYLTAESLNVLGRAGQGGGIVGPALNPTAGWGLASYELPRDKIALSGKTAQATVTGTFRSSRKEEKTVNFVVYLESYEEIQPEGGRQAVWRINEIETRYHLAEQLLGKTYADLWRRQLELQQEWKRATTPSAATPAPGSR